MKEDFKRFVKANPKLINYVNEHKVSWQSLYEIYSLYGEDEKVWEKYVINKSTNLEDLIDLFKNLNLESIKNVVDGLQKGIGIIQDLTKDNNKHEEYIPKGEFKNLDD